MFRAKAQLGLIVLLMSLMSGCSGQKDKWLAARPTTAKARGEVTFLGKPLEGAIVVFQPVAPGGIGASAVTDTQGKFELMTFPPAAGAVPGQYSVSVMKTAMPSAGTVQGDEGSPIHVVSVIPERYSLPTSSQLSVNIPEDGTEDMVFHLKL